MVTHPAENVPDWPKTAANTNNFYVDQLDAIPRFRDSGAVRTATIRNLIAFNPIQELFLFL
jgi:hypothetical protein